MSEMERASALLASVPQYKIGYVISYLEGLIAAEAAETSNAETLEAISETIEWDKKGAEGNE